MSLDLSSPTPLFEQKKKKAFQTTMAVTFKGSYTVKPSESTLQGVMSLSIFDQTGSIAHEPSIYLYRRPPNDWLSPPDAVADALKKSLSRALVHFYPLAGRVRWAGGGGGHLELNCNAMGAEFVEAEADSELDNFFGPDDFSPSQKYRHLIPDVDHKYRSFPFEEIPLLLVQLTRFSCGGISLGVALSQAVADGIASLHFMSEWAGLSRGEPLKMAPFLDRGVLRAGEPPRVSISADPAAFYLPKLMIPKPKRFDYQGEIKMDKTTVAKLRLGKDEVEKVKKMANEDREESEITRAYTRFEALSAHLWRSVTKARNHEYPEQPTVLAIPIDSRNRVQPPLPWNYFGNALCEVYPRSAAGELRSRPVGYAASRIRAAIEKANSEFIWTWIDNLKNLPDLACVQNLQSHLDGIPSLQNPNLCVISWLTLPIYGLDFGWGKEIYMGPGEIEGEWSYLLPCPSGDGSVILVLRLETAHMDSFKKHFYEDIV